MFGRLTRRAIEALVALFALLGFCFVPLGEKTALEHLAAIVRTDAAAEAGRGLIEAAQRARRRVFDEVDSPAKPSALSRTAPADAGAPDASLEWIAAR